MDLTLSLKDWLMLGVAAVATLSGWVAYAKERREIKALKSSETNRLSDLARSAVKDIINELRQEIHRLQERVEELEDENAAFRKMHNSMIAEKDAELMVLRGRVRQLEATVESYDRKLTENGIPHAPPVKSFWTAQDGRHFELMELSLPEDTGDRG